MIVMSLAKVLKIKNGEAATQIISIPPPCAIHGMWGGRMTSCVAVPTKKNFN